MLNIIFTEERILFFPILPLTITTIPFLPNEEVATNYTELQLVVEIHDAENYFICEWHGPSITSIAILNNTNQNIECKNQTTSAIQTTCFYSNGIVTATLHFLAPINVNQAGFYFVGCMILDSSNFIEIVAQIYIEISGKRRISYSLFQNMLHLMIKM